MIINLIIGDWSNDGHGKTETVVYEVYGINDRSELIEKYKKGVEILGYDITKYCQEYEDNILPREVILRLISFGFKEDYLDKVTNELGITIEEFIYNPYRTSADEYAEIYLFIAKLGDMRISYKPISGIDLNIGGYGLFY